MSEERNREIEFQRVVVAGDARAEQLPEEMLHFYTEADELPFHIPRD